MPTTNCAPPWRVTPLGTSPPTLRMPGRPASPPPSPRSACRDARPDHPLMRRLLLPLAIALLLLPAGGAFASGAKVIRDCTDDGRLEGHYSQRDLREALNSLPSDIDEYTDCRQVIRRAAFGGAGGGGKGGSGGGNGGGAPGGEFGGFGGPGSGAAPPAPPPAQRSALAKARLEGGAIRVSSGALVRPGVVGHRTSATDVPEPLVIAVIVLALAALAAGAPTLRSRVLARRGA